MNAKFKTRNINIKFFGSREIDHNVRTRHGSQWRGNEASRLVSVTFARLEDRFFTYNTVTVDVLRSADGF